MLLKFLTSVIKAGIVRNAVVLLGGLSERNFEWNGDCGEGARNCEILRSMIA